MPIGLLAAFAFLPILATKADTLATGCPACMLQIIDLLSHAQSSIRVCHPIELYARSLRQTAGPDGSV